MGNLCDEKTPPCEKVAMELEEGEKFARQLQVLLRKPLEEDGLVSAEELVLKILRSLSRARSCPQFSGNACDDHHHDRDGDQNLQKQENFEESGERSKKKRPASRDSCKRGCYKRKKNSQTWTVVSSSYNIHDGQAWRKYGQKTILNTKYPRSYFRCTHKFVQGCPASKQVQRMNDGDDDDEKHKYETTYIGHHTCRETTTTSCFPQVVAEKHDEEPYYYWSAVTSTSGRGSSSSIVPKEEGTTINQERKEETTSTDHDQPQDISSLDAIGWEDLVSLEFSSGEPAAAGTSMEFSCDSYRMMDSNQVLDLYNELF